MCPCLAQRWGGPEVRELRQERLTEEDARRVVAILRDPRPRVLPDGTFADWYVSSLSTLTPRAAQVSETLTAIRIASPLVGLLRTLLPSTASSARRKARARALLRAPANVRRAHEAMRERTDRVFGSARRGGRRFTEESRLARELHASEYRFSATEIVLLLVALGRLLAPLDPADKEELRQRVQHFLGPAPQGRDGHGTEGNDAARQNQALQARSSIRHDSRASHHRDQDQRPRLRAVPASTGRRRGCT
jgi:hypothetical protein